MITKIDSFAITGALIRHLDRPSLVMLPNFYFAGGECDLLTITDSNYAIEYEIKISKADWNNDIKKDKWQLVGARDKISRFYYVIPEILLDKKPIWLDKITPKPGIICVKQTEAGMLYCTKYFEAERNPDSKKLTTDQMNAILANGYHRYKQHMLKKYLGENDGSQALCIL